MNVLDLHRAAGDAKAASATRPATAIVHDSPDARLVIFRLGPGQSVGMRAADEPLVLLATIAPRPGDRSRAGAA